MVKKPCCARTRPAPWQVGQVTGWAPPSAPEPLQPVQVAEVGTRISGWRPLKASSSEISIL